MLIPLTQNKVAIIDDEDFHLVSHLKWWAVKAGKTFYAAAHDGKKTVYMHRLIIGHGPRCDHKDRNGLNNTRDNLRASTHQSNLCNRGPASNNTSGYKGVFWDKSRGKWLAAIGVANKMINLGRFEDKDEAALAYNKASRKYHGEFAYQNEVDYAERN